MTKPNRDITAEIEHTKECIEFMAEDFRRDCICFMKPTTSTKEILKEFDKDTEEYNSPIWSRLKTPIRTTLELYVNKALTTRTNELLGAMKMEKIGQNVILNCVSRNDYKKSYLCLLILCSNSSCKTKRRVFDPLFSKVHRCLDKWNEP